MYNFPLINSYFFFLISKNINPDVLEKYRVKFFSVGIRCWWNNEKESEKMHFVSIRPPNVAQPLQIFFHPIEIRS